MHGDLPELKPAKAGISKITKGPKGKSE